ncbi:MAG: tetratricopeptide repeat protein [Candidatus Cloacimonetes bacterium]|nr:tetratricopeptide repeat protein [Candidatus Cloacimonadota bacterium]
MNYSTNGVLPQCCHRLLAGYRNAADIPLPLTHTQQAGILFLDLSHFTAFTEAASREGRYGVELVTGLLDAYFETVVQAVHRQGGSMLKYGGDSTLSIFPGSYDVAMPRLLACRAEILERTGEGFCASEQHKPVQLHGSAGFGDVSLHITGDPSLHLDYYASGEALARVFSLGDAAHAGEILLLDGLDEAVPATDDAQLEHVDCGLAESFLPETVRRKLNTLEFRAELRNTAVCFLQLASSDGDGDIAPDIYHQAMTAMQRLVYEMGGTINKIDFTDKGYMVILTFGVPFLHFDDIERAFTCAYRLQQLDLSGVRLRAGVTYSNIFAGLLGTPQRFEYGIIGNAVNTAARLMAASDWGGVTFSREIMPRIAARFESELVRRVKVKGISEPVELHRLVRELPECWSAYRSQHGNTRMLGRGELAAELRTALDSGRHVLLQGDAGAGKSLLLYHLLQPFLDNQSKIHLVALDEFDARRPLGLVSLLLHRQLGVAPLPGGLDDLTAWCSREDVPADISLLRRVLLGASTDPDESRTALGMLADIVVRACSEVAVLAVDNAQWLDTLSRRVIEAMLPRLQGKRPVCLLASRPVSWLSDWNSLPLRTETLAPFGPALTGELVRTRLPHVTDDAIQALHRITGGNPMFVMEMTKSICENVDTERIILNAAELHILVRRGVIPESMENLLLAHYENLDDDAQHMLRVASIIGRAFSVETLRVVGHRELGREVMDVLASLESTALINGQNINPEIEYIFSNNLMREAIYRTVLRGEKRNLHNRIAAWYEQRTEGDKRDWCEVVANHYILAENHPGTREWAWLTGEKNRCMGDTNNSLFYYRAAQKAGATEPMLLLRTAQALQLLGEVAEADTILRQFDDQEPLSGEPSDLLRFLLVKANAIRSNYTVQKALIESWGTPCELPWYRNIMHIYYLEALLALGKIEDFESNAGEFLALLEAAEDTEFIGRLSSVMGLCYQNQARYNEAALWFNRKLEAAVATGDRIGVHGALGSLGVVASRLGDKKAAAEWYRKALDEAERIGDKDGCGRTLMDMAILERNAGHNEKARETYRRCLDIARQVGNRTQEQTVLYNIGESLYYDERIDEAKEYFFKALAIAEKTGDQVGVSFCYDALGDAFFTLENYERALEFYTRNVPLQTKLGDREGLAHTYGNLGNIAKMAGDWDAAIERYSTQQKMLAEVGDRDGEGRAWFNWAMIHVEKKQDNQAVEPLQKAIDCFRACEAQQLVAIAEDQMRQLKERLGEK